MPGLLFAGADMEVLYCMSDFLPQVIGTEMPDAAKVCVDEMCARYGAWLKSDMMTVPHHGWNQNRYRARNGTIRFYTLVDPAVVFWPDGVKAQAKKMAWDGKPGGDWEANSYLINRLHVRQCVIAGSVTQTFALPYTP